MQSVCGDQRDRVRDEETALKYSDKFVILAIQ